MRINELTGSKELVTPFKQDLSKLPNRWTGKQSSVLEKFSLKLRELGFRYVGAASFSTVFSHPTLNYVIKVFRADDAYKYFVNFCHTHKGNIHLPKFRGKIIRIDNKTYAVRMERLKSSYSNQNCATVLSYAIDYSIQNHQSPISIEEYYNNIIKKLIDQGGRDGLIKAIQDNIGLASILFEIRKQLPNTEFRFDLHNNNVMLRGDDIIVVTDPICVEGFTQYAPD